MRESRPWRGHPHGQARDVLTFSRTLAAELTGVPVRVQVLRPGLTATEFRPTQGRDPVAGDAPRVHDDGGMPAEDVVTASLRAPETGEAVCVPGLVGGGRWTASPQRR